MILEVPCEAGRASLNRPVVSTALRASHHDPTADGAWQGVDEEDQEDDEDEQDESDDDVLLVVLPDEVVQALERAHEPREGGVWAAGEEIGERGRVQYPEHTSDLVFLGAHRRRLRSGVEGPFCLKQQERNSLPGGLHLLLPVFKVTLNSVRAVGTQPETYTLIPPICPSVASPVPTSCMKPTLTTTVHRGYPLL